MSEQMNTEAEEQVVDDQQEAEQETESPEVENETEEAEESGTATDETKEEEEPNYQKIIAEKAFEAREQKRRAEELQRRLEEMETQKTQPQSRPEIPPMPDPWDDDFEQKARARDQAIIDQAAFDAQERVRQQQQQEAQQQKQQQQQQELYNKAMEYTKRATALGVDTQELQQVGQRLAGHVSDEIAGYILDSDKGPLMAKYLASNPMELDTLANMDPMRAAVYLETTVKSKAEKLGVKKPSRAPEPTEEIKGSGAPPQRGPKGARFE